ncbi:MAG: glycoside hydrolase family 15 protein [Spirochaetales bacterium]|nr:glycoside hydrolase family 15 protein [Spirochaetales bacterium]
MTPDDLYKKSIDMILENQHPSGGYVASPTFPTYNYCWFRDGAYIAHAMDLAGELESADQFHDWAANNILRRQEQLDQVCCLVDEGREIPEELHLHTRYTLDGNEGNMEWENFQLDGLGTWLWSLGEHLKCREIPLPADRVKLSDAMADKVSRWKKAAALVISYLKRIWALPCYDLWEENRNGIHIYTLSSIYGGLKSGGQFLEVSTGEVCEKIKDRILKRGVVEGHLSKFEGSSLVDGSLIGVSIPYGVFELDEPLMRATAVKIEEDLLRAGGVHRYRGDTYYGGGIWILLRGWLALYQLEMGDRNAAEEALLWMCGQADSEGHLPEQVSDDLLDSEMLQGWIDKWGDSASPLLWSHAVYIWLYNKLKFN